MKKLLIITNLFWVSVFVFTAFNSPDQTPVKKADKVNTGAISKAEKNTGFVDGDCKTICSNYTGVPFKKDDGRISGAFAQQISNLYIRNHYRLSNTIVPPMDSRSVWFSLETLKSFLWEIESRTATCRGGCANLNLGVRIYFAEYPNAANASDPQNSFNSQFAKHHTVFMVPTYAKSIPQRRGQPPVYENYDFDPTRLTYRNEEGVIGSLCQPVTLRELVSFGATADNLILMPAEKSLVRRGTAGSPASTANVSRSSTTSSTVSYVQNHGTLCPPINCPGMAF